MSGGGRLGLRGSMRALEGVPWCPGWDGGGMLQDRFGFQPSLGSLWLRRRIPSACRAARGSWCPRQGCGVRRKPPPLTFPSPPCHYSITCWVFPPSFILIYVIPVWFLLRFSAVFPGYFPISLFLFFSFFFFYHSFHLSPLPFPLAFPFHRLHTTSPDVMTNPG